MMVKQIFNHFHFEVIPNTVIAQYYYNITTVGSGSDCVHFYGDKCFRHNYDNTRALYNIQ